MRAKHRVRDRSVRVLARSPLAAARRTWGRHRLRVLAYHDVGDRDLFESHLDHLLTHYTPVDLDAVLRWVGGGNLPENPVLVTFDDGHESWVRIAAPAMALRDIPGVAFVVSGVLGTTRPYWWEEVAGLGGPEARRVIAEMKRMPDEYRQRRLAELRKTVGEIESATNLYRADLIELERAGIEVGNHTVSHPLLDKCSPDRVEAEVDEAAVELADAVGHEIRAFAYPNGNWSAHAQIAAERAGHSVGFIFDHREQRRSTLDPLRISRIRVNWWDSLEEFSFRVSGLHPSMRSLATGLGRGGHAG